MSCDYPCHVCDPEAWAEETKAPPYDFDAVYERASSGMDAAFLRERRGPIWWVPMEGWPEDVTITEERDTEDIGFGTHPWTTMLMDHRIYMERLADSLWNPQRFRIISYMQTVLDWDKGIWYISAVQSATPPPWGWWMPTLNPVL